MVTFEEGSDVTQLTVPIELINDILDELDIQRFEVQLEVVTAMNPALLMLQGRNMFTGQIQDDEGKWVLLKSDKGILEKEVGCNATIKQCLCMNTTLKIDTTL